MAFKLLYNLLFFSFYKKYQKYSYLYYMINSKSFEFKGKTYKIGDLFMFGDSKNKLHKLPIKSIKSNYDYGRGMKQIMVYGKFPGKSLQCYVETNLPNKK